jgi:hypothetical protein
MRHSYEQSYDLSNYDDDMCLKPPLLLWLVVLYLSRAIMLPVAIGIGHVAGVDSAAMTVLRGFWSQEQLLPALLAIPVLYALCRRVPTASQQVRWIWSRGRIFLTIAAALDIAVPLLAPLWHHDIDDQLLALAVVAGIKACFLLYALMARRVRDTFADFPLSPEVAAK